MSKDWKYFAGALASPVFFFLCLDFLYRLSEMNVARDAWLSFAFLEAPSVLAAAAAALLLAALTSALSARAGEILKRAAMLAGAWCVIFLFLNYLKKWIFSFTFADEMGTVALPGKYVLIVALAAAVAVAWARGKSAGFRKVLETASGRLFALISAVTVANLAVLGFFLLRAPADAQASAPAAKRPNMLIVVTDTLAATHLSAYGGRVATPNFDRWSREGFFFENARTDVTSTGPSISSILTGRSPKASGVLNYHPVPGNDAEKNLATYLQSFGYRTRSQVDLEYAALSFHGFPTPTDGETLSYLPERADAFNRWMAECARRMGFSLRFRLPPIVTHTLKPFTEAFGALARSWEHPARSPFFEYVHLYLPSRIAHVTGPAVTLANYPRFYPPAEQPEIDAARADYDRSVAEWDAGLGLLLDGLKSSKALGNTIVVITADHGESFDRGFWGHGNDLSEDSIRVPVLILAPGLSGKTIASPFLNSDIAPTVLALAGLAQPAWMDGIPATGTEIRRSAVTYNNLIRTNVRAHIPYPGLSTGHSVALFEDGSKFIERPAGVFDELFDLKDDPSETKNIAAERPEKAAEMKKQLSEIFSEAAIVVR